MVDVLRAKDIAEILHCGLDKAYLLMHQSDFPSVKLGGRYFVLRDEFEQFLRNNSYKEYKLCDDCDR